MTVRELIEQLQAIENRTLPVIFVDPYGDAEDEWEFDDQA